MVNHGLIRGIVLSQHPLASLAGPVASRPVNTNPSQPYSVMRTPPQRVSAAAAPTASAPVLSKDSELAGAIKALVVSGDRDAARERFADLVANQQRRAVRIAYHYLR